MPHLTTHEELRDRILTLAGIVESPTPFVSCYLNLQSGKASALKTMQRRANLLRRVLNGKDLDDFEESVGCIKTYINKYLLPETKGLAFFARSNFEKEFYMPLQFAVPLPDNLRIYPTPNIFNLIKLKDTYERYLVMVATKEWVRIIEVNLGATSVQAWSENPALRERVGQEWSETQYQLYHHNREESFLGEIIQILQELLDYGDHNHLIIAGDPEITACIRKVLPESLISKLMDTIPTSLRDSETDIIEATLSILVEQEEQESRSVVERLIHHIQTQGLAVIGAKDCLDRLQCGEVDTLIILQSYNPDPVWLCSSCNKTIETAPEFNICPNCNSTTVSAIDLREELVRQAGQKDCPVEVVEHSEALIELGGVGCLLRFRTDL